MPKPLILLTDEIVPPPALVRDGLETLPVIIRAQGERASRRFIEFFTASIRNRNTRMAYARAVKQFFDWCDDPPAETSGHRGQSKRRREVDDYRIVRPEAIERFWAEQSFGADQVLMLLPTRFSMGFMLSQPGMRFKPWAGRGMKQDLVRTGYTGAVAVQRTLTPTQFGDLAEIPPEFEWLANLTNPKTRCVCKNDCQRFNHLCRPYAHPLNSEPSPTCT